MIHAILLAALATVPQPGIVECRVDVLERNSVLCCDDGHVVLVQMIYRDQCEIRAWRMIGAQYPYRTGGCWQVLFSDGDGTLRRVRAASVIETWTLYDNEVIEREWLPPEHRRGIGK